MKPRFDYCGEVEAFLLAEFARREPVDVLNAFAWAFFDGDYAVTDQKRVWKRRVRRRKATASRLGSCRTAIQLANDLRDTSALEEIWHRSYPKTGGTEPADHILADWVKMAFEGLKEPVTFGLSGIADDEPSTKFGRVVRAVLQWRRSSAHWRRVAQAAVQGTGPLSDRA